MGREVTIRGPGVGPAVLIASGKDAHRDNVERHVADAVEGVRLVASVVACGARHFVDNCSCVGLWWCEDCGVAELTKCPDDFCSWEALKKASWGVVGK